MVDSGTTSPFFPGATTKRRSLDSIPARPPTPPRESPRSKKTATKDPFLTTNTNIVLSSSSISSRETSPPSSSTDKPKKRVIWSPWTKYHKPDSPPTSTPIRSLIDPKNLKSILKPSPAPLYGESPFGRPIAAHTFTSFASMLESVLQALASTERSKKLDTYITFSNTLKAYDEIPDMKAMEEKLPILCGFLRRDLEAKLEDGGNTDSQLIQQAIKLLVILAWTPCLVEAMDDSDATFFLEHAITKIEDASTPKIIVNHNLHLLAQQKFPSRIVTMERASRIITALETLDERVTGKSITKERIDIYYKLLFQAKHTMLVRVNDWMDNLFGGLLSSVSEVRNRALICIAEVSRVLGKEKSIPRTLTNIFSRVVKGKRMFDSIKERLDQFIRDGEGVFVARMWGIVLLCVKTLGDHWEYFTPWLRIIEGCFNVSDKDVKVEAQVAWSKLIYSMNIGPTTTRKLLGLLCKPLEQYLDPKNAYSNTKKPRKAAMANVSVLLYYGFRPNATAKQLSEVWDLVVVGLVEKMALSSKEEVAEGCSILSTMFDGSVQRTWQETRVLAAPPMSAEDVPRLDPKWVRSNTALVLKTLEVALERGHWRDDGDKGVKPLWKKFTKTLADAGSKEIKVSAELMESVAHLFNMFQRLWTIGPSSLAGAKEIPPTTTSSFMKKFSYLILTALESLGTFPFTEKQLAYDDQSKFSPAATPTHKYSSGTSSVVLHPPVLHMFQLFLRPSKDVYVDEEYYECVRSILWKCVIGQDSRRKKLGLLAACAGLLPHRDARDVDHGMWQILGQLARKCLPTPAREKTLLTPSPMVAEFRDVVKILEWGCKYELPGWKRLFDEFCGVVGGEQGEMFVAGVVIDPIAEVLRHQVLEQENVASLRKGVMLVERTGWPKSKAIADYFLKTPFGGVGRRSAGSDAFEKLYDLLDHLLCRSYTLCVEGLPMTDALNLLISVGDLIAKCPAVSLLPLLKRIQEGLSVWITDAGTLISTKPGEPALKTIAVWEKVLEAIERLPQHDGKVLDALQVLITSGLQSKRKPVVNATIKAWNGTFGKQQSMHYPKSVRTALKKLRPIADLLLPTFPESTEEEPVHTPPQFSESQDLVNDGRAHEREAWSNTPSRLASPFREPRGTASPGPSVLVKDTPVNSRRTPGSARKTPTRPKHMDSQIEFAEIESGGSMPDSQVLTEHQKEVKERQSEAARTLFSGLGVVGKGKEKEKERKPVPAFAVDSPTSGQGGVAISDEMDISRIEETQPSQELNETASFISEMPVESSYPQFLLTKAPGEEDTSSAISSVESSVKEVSPELVIGPSIIVDWGEDGEDVEMTPADEDPDSSIISDPPSIDEDFVDAPDHLPSEAEDSPIPSRRKGRVLVTVEVDSGAPGDINAHSSPDAQIIDEERASHGLPATPKSKGKKKARKGSEVAVSPEMLDTVVVVARQSSGSPYRTRSARLAEKEGTPRKLAGGEDTPSKGVKSKQLAVEDTPSRGARTAKQQEKAVEATPSRGPKGKPVQEKLAGKLVEDTPSKFPKSPRQLMKFSPPRTRSSAKKGVAETPRFVMLEPGSRKRKFLSAEDSPIPSEGRQPSTENFPSPTPKGRRRSSAKPPPAKRTRSVVGDVPADPDVSFVGETQLSFGSSIPDSYEQQGHEVDELVGPTPYAGARAAATSLFDVEKEKEEKEEKEVSLSQVTEIDPEEEEEVVTPGKRRRMRMSLSRASRSPEKTRALAAKISSRAQVEEEEVEVEVEEEEVSPPPAQAEMAESMEVEEAAAIEDESSVVANEVSGQEAMDALRKALLLLESARLAAGECREAENLVFDAFVKLRQRGHEH